MARTRSRERISFCAFGEGRGDFCGAEMGSFVDGKVRSPEAKIKEKFRAEINLIIKWPRTAESGIFLALVYQLRAVRPPFGG